MEALHRTEERQAAVPVGDGPVLLFLLPTGRFLAHFVEMCVAMCAGAVVLSLLFFEGAGLLGYSNPPQRFPELSTAVIAINLSLPMAVWMRFRGMAWRPTLEMSGATITVGILLIIAFWVGSVPRSSLLPVQTRLACPLMFVVMLFRLNHYTG